MKRPEPWMRLAESVCIPPLWTWFKWRFEGLEHLPRQGPALVACNHISYLDPLCHGYFVEKGKRRPRFMAKIELYRNPLLRAVLRGARQIPVRRGSGERAPVEAALKALAAGEVVMVYPESTVTKNDDFSPMAGKTGIARLTLATGVPVIPLAVWGSQHVWQREGTRSLRFGRPIWVKAGRPLSFSLQDEDPDHPQVLRRVTDEVMSELSVLVDDLRARYPKEWS
ncbi:MAG TPA: lysophospholipid acyltransferase family protein [Actinomycetota bacterium]|nr:lysophospholipid acyltransferase family protein [Actinomycetota bacterium]